MKYGRIESGRLIDVVLVPTSEEGAPLAWLSIQFPTLSGWVSVPDNVVSGATDNGNGTYTNPIVPAQTIFRWDEFEFRKRFTATERKAIMAATLENNDLADFEAMLQAAGRTNTMVVSTDPLVTEAMFVLVATELITDGRRKAILGIESV